jgi:hypothetical protein
LYGIVNFAGKNRTKFHRIVLDGIMLKKRGIVMSNTCKKGAEHEDIKRVISQNCRAGNGEGQRHWKKGR